MINDFTQPRNQTNLWPPHQCENDNWPDNRSFNWFHTCVPGFIDQWHRWKCTCILNCIVCLYFINH